MKIDSEILIPLIPDQCNQFSDEILILQLFEIISSRNRKKLPRCVSRFCSLLGLCLQMDSDRTADELGDHLAIRLPLPWRRTSQCLLASDCVLMDGGTTSSSIQQQLINASGVETHQRGHVWPLTPSSPPSESRTRTSGPPPRGHGTPCHYGAWSVQTLNSSIFQLAPTNSIKIP